MSRKGPSTVRTGTFDLRMATHPIKRKILLEMSVRSMQWTEDTAVQITPGGRGALSIGSVAERWLEEAPGGPLALESDEGQAALRALLDGWTAAIVHTLAAAPATPPDLEATIGGLSGEDLKDRLARMQATGLLEAHPGDGEGAVYAPTDWLRAGLAPLLAAARLELREPQDEAEPPTPLDIEAAFQLALPLLRLPTDVGGSCALAVELDGDADDGPAGVTAQVEEGRVVRCEARLDEAADARAVASAGEWFDTVIEPDAKRVRTSGERLLANLLLNGLHKALFGAGYG